MLQRFLDIKTSSKIAVVCGLIALFGVTGANAQESGMRNNLQSKLNQIKSQIGSYRQEIIKTRQQEATLNNEISIYDNEIKSLELQIEANQTQKDDVSLQIAELQTQIDRRKAEIDESKKLLAQLIVQMAELDEDSYLNISLGTEDFSSFLDQIQYTRSLQSQVYSLVSRIKEIKSKLELQQQDLKAQLTKLEELKGQLEVTQDSLDSQKANKLALLTQTQGVERNYQTLLGKSKNEENQLQEEIADLDAAARKRAGGSSNISPKKGVLAMPMAGTLTQAYGNTGFTSLGYNFHNGLDIAAPAGTPIYAAADGTVANCDTGQAAYGNWCTIKHTVETATGPRNIVTLYAHMRSFKVIVGQKVKQGDLVGYEGNSGNTTRLLYGPERGYHIHFSVFDASTYSVTKGSHTATYGPYSVPSGVSYNPMNFIGR